MNSYIVIGRAKIMFILRKLSVIEWQSTSTEKINKELIGSVRLDVNVNSTGK